MPHAAGVGWLVWGWCSCEGWGQGGLRAELTQAAWRRGRAPVGTARQRRAGPREQSCGVQGAAGAAKPVLRTPRADARPHLQQGVCRVGPRHAPAGHLRHLQALAALQQARLCDLEQRHADALRGGRREQEQVEGEGGLRVLEAESRAAAAGCGGGRGRQRVHARARRHTRTRWSAAGSSCGSACLQHLCSLIWQHVEGAQPMHPQKSHLAGEPPGRRATSVRDIYRLRRTCSVLAPSSSRTSKMRAAVSGGTARVKSESIHSPAVVRAG